MPVDASIPLATQTPQPYDPMAAYSRVVQLQNALQGQQVQQAQLTGLNQENQMRGMQMQDQQALRSAFSQWDGQNPQDLFTTAAKNGASPMTLLQLKGSLLDQQMKAATLEKDQRANLAAKNTAIQSKLAPIANETDPAKQAQLWNQASQQLIADGTITPQEAAQHPYPGSRDAVNAYVAGLNLDKWTLGQQQLGTAAQRNAAADATYQKMISDVYAGVKNADDLNAANMKLMAELPPKYANQLLTKYDPDAVQAIATSNLSAKDRSDIQHQRTEEQQAAANATETARHNQVEEGQGAQRVGIEAANANTNRGRLGLEQSKQTFDQAAIVRTAQALAGGDLTRLKDIASLRGDQRLQIYDLAKQINPNFNTAEVDRKIKNEDYYANGAGAQHLQSFGTFLEHAGSASDAVNTYRNTSSPLINRPLNWIKNNAAGDPAYQSFAASLEPVRKEFEGFLLGGRALYGDDRKAAETILSDNSSPAQIQAALKTMGHTALARFTEENYRYKKVSGHDLVDPFSPEALEGAQKIGVNLSGGQNGGNPAPAGQPRPAPAPAPQTRGGQQNPSSASKGNVAPEGTIITNPTTGVRLKKIGGEWQPI